jgi:predicted lipid-binding transport protein (Tim44 family)
MNGSIDIFTLLFLVLAVVIILKLRSVLGRRTGDEASRYERFKAEREARQNAAAVAQDKIVTLPRREREPEAPVAAEQRTTAEAEQRLRKFAAGDDQIARGLIDIYHADPSFDVEHFVKGARVAYEMIVRAFAEGDRKTLKNLLSREVYDGFVAAISERESRGEQVDQTFVGMDKADVVEAELKQGIAQLTVRFVSQLISATRDRAGAIVNGDPKRIKEVTDIWTFARDATSRDPNWKLVATQAAG